MRVLFKSVYHKRKKIRGNTIFVFFVGSKNTRKLICTHAHVLTRYDTSPPKLELYHQTTNLLYHNFFLVYGERELALDVYGL